MSKPKVCIFCGADPPIGLVVLPLNTMPKNSVWLGPFVLTPYFGVGAWVCCEKRRDAFLASWKEQAIE